MVSKAHATQAALTGETPHPQAELPAGRTALKPFCITHIRRSQPNKVQIDRIAAADNTDAQRRAAQQFPDSTILRVCRARQGEAASPTKTDGADTPPNARFIRGKFRPTDTEDEPTLRDLCDQAGI